MAINVAMPIGIPEPALDFTQALPEQPVDWSTPVTGYYYIDSGAGTDTANTYGTPSAPRRSIPNPIPAGSFVVLRNRYTVDVGGSHLINGLGTDATWVAGVSGPVFIDGGRGAVDEVAMSFSSLIWGSYMIIDGLVTEPNKVIKLGSPSAGRGIDNTVFRNSDVLGDGISNLSGISVDAPYDTPGSTARNIIVYNNFVHEFGPIDTLTDVDANGMIVSGDTSNVWLLYNRLYRCSGAGMQLSPSIGSTTFTEKVYVGGNVIHYVAQAGIGTKYVKNSVISSNKIYNVLDKPWTPSKAIGVQYAPDNIWILYNEIYDARFGIRGAGTNNTGQPVDGWPIFMIGNFIYGINKLNEAYPYDPNNLYNNSSAIASTGAYDAYAANNVLWDSEVGFTTPSVDGKWVVENNTFSNMYLNSLLMDSSATLNSVTNNIFQATDFLIDVAGAETWAAFEAIVGTGNIQEDLVDTTGKSAQEIKDAIESSPTLLDGGVNVPQPVLDAFSDTFGIPLTRGYYDKVVPQGVSRDIGVWEQGPLFIPTLPTSASDLLVDAGSSVLRWKLNSQSETDVKVLKNGSEIASLSTGAVAHPISGIASSVDSYSVQVINSTGSADSLMVSSDILGITPIPGSLSQELDDTKSYVAVRPYINSTTGAVTIDEPQYTGDKYGIDSTKVLFTKSAIEVGNGFNYVTNDNGSISGSVGGSGTCDVILALNSYNGVSTSRITVNSTYADITCAEGDLAKYVASIGISTDTPYTITPITTDTKHATGIVSITEQ